MLPQCGWRFIPRDLLDATLQVLVDFFLCERLRGEEHAEGIEVDGLIRLVANGEHARALLREVAHEDRETVADERPESQVDLQRTTSEGRGAAETC